MKDGCPTGWHIELGGGCQKCPKGTYSANHSLTECHKCPVGLTTNVLETDRGAASLADCTKCDNSGKFSYGTCTPDVDEDSGKPYPNWQCDFFGWGKACSELCAGTSVTKFGIPFPCSGQGTCNNCPIAESGAGAHEGTYCSNKQSDVPPGNCNCEMYVRVHHPPLILLLLLRLFL